MNPGPSGSWSPASIPELKISRIDSIPWNSELDAVSRGFHASPHEVILDLPTLARWRIRSSGIEISLHDPVGWDRAVDLGLTTPLAAWSVFRGEIPLLAACAIPPGSNLATLVCARSGGGKSTLLATLVRRGWTFLSDAPCRLIPDPKAPMVRPGPPAIILWRKALEPLGIPQDEAPHVESQPYLRVWSPPRVEDVASRIGSVVILKRTDERNRPASPTLAKVSGMDSIRALEEYMFQPRMIAAMGARGKAFESMARLAASTNVWSWEPSSATSSLDLAMMLEELVR